MRLAVVAMFGALVVVPNVADGRLHAQVPTQVRGDGIVALVGSNTPQRGTVVILHSDVELRARIRLTGQMRDRLPLGAVPEGLMAATLEEMIGETLIAREAERVQVASPAARDLVAERRRLAQQAGGEARLERLRQATGASREELESIASRRALVRVFLEANLEGQSRVDDSAVERAFAGGEHPFLGQELEDVREAMRVWLTQQRLTAAVERWVNVLRARTTVRIVAPYS